MKHFFTMRWWLLLDFGRHLYIDRANTSESSIPGEFSVMDVLVAAVGR
jgi:hypothetical protein